MNDASQPDPVAELSANLRQLLELTLRAKSETSDRLRRHVLIAGVRYFALVFVARVVGGEACSTHAFARRLARRTFDAALNRLETALEAELERMRMPEGV